MIHVGDCRAILPTFDADSVDAVVTDPPYELGFMGKGWDRQGVAFDPETWRAVKRVMKPGAPLLAFGGTRTWHRLAVAIEDAGFQIIDSLMWLHGQGFPKHKTLLKPGWEPVIVAKKPGTGGLQVEACRIGGGGQTTYSARISGDYAGTGYRTGTIQGKEIPSALGRWPANVVLSHLPECVEVGTRRLKSNARPNVVGQDGASVGYEGGWSPVKKSALAADPDGLETIAAWECAEGCPVAMLDGQSGERKSGGGNKNRRTADWYEGGPFASIEKPTIGGDTGGASRFFYCAKASRRERNAGLDGLPERTHRSYEGGPIVSADHPETAPGGHPTASANHHPTVKPLALMRWLVRLAAPADGLILDPFVGSGTTGIAASLEGFRFVGIEQSEEYAVIARRRIAEATPPLFAVAS